MEHELDILTMETLVAEGKMVKTVITTLDGTVFTCYDYPFSPFAPPSPRLCNVKYPGLIHKGKKIE